jgi:hypothetical protein
VGNIRFEQLYNYLMTYPDEIGARNDDDNEKRKAQLQQEWERFGFFPLPDHSGATLKKIVQRALEEGTFQTAHLGVSRLDRLGIQGLRRTGVAQINTGFFTPQTLEAKELTKAQILGRKIAYYVQDHFLRPYVPGFSDSFIVSTTTSLGVRTSRKIKAECNLKRSQLYEKFDDVIAVFNPKQTRLAEIPYRTLVPMGAESLLVASGRSFPSEGRIAAPYREGPSTLLMGQAAGTAAALCVQEQKKPHQLDTRHLQKELLKQDAYLGDRTRLRELNLA